MSSLKRGLTLWWWSLVTENRRQRSDTFGRLERHDVTHRSDVFPSDFSQHAVLQREGNGFLGFGRVERVDVVRGKYSTLVGFAAKKFLDACQVLVLDLDLEFTGERLLRRQVEVGAEQTAEVEVQRVAGHRGGVDDRDQGGCQSGDGGGELHFGRRSKG